MAVAGEPGTRRAITQGQVIVTALVALATGVLSLVFQVAPWLKPDPRDRVGADVAVFALEPGVTLDGWIDREFPPSQRAALHRRYPDGAARGALLYVRTVVDGHKHRDVTLRYGVYDAARHTRVPERNIDGPQLDPLALSAPSERSVKVLWVPDLSFEPGRLFIRVELWDDDGMLAVADSPPVAKGRFVQLQG